VTWAIADDRRRERRHLAIGGTLLGIGLGGFFDGIVLHQILQWHHMLSAVVPTDDLDGLRRNALADGLFHAATYLCTVAGLAALWSAPRGRAGPWPRRLLVGLLLAGWGGFNLVEGLVNHQWLGLHHVRPGPDRLAWDLGFLAWGAAMLVVGILWARQGFARWAEPAPAGGVGPRSA
jgi:uncharacterized membrane protein